jgi:L-alanine-DL-glutamate epimerase-like enolase superfamily enzyme
MDASLPGHPYVKTALDMACWDILGKFANLPLCDLFGGRTEEPVRLHSSLSTGTPQEMAATVEAARAKGYRIHSCKVGGDDVAADVARIRAVANTLTEEESVTFDVNCAWLPDVAIQVMNAVRDLPVYFEQPCGTYEECLTVRRATIQPIILDESINTYQDIVRAHADRACEAVGLKIGRVGGLTKARVMRDFCVEMGLKMNIEDTGGSVLTDTAAAHLAQATPVRHRRGTVLYHEMVARDIAPGQGVRNAGGWVQAPDLPGIGVEPDMGLLGSPTAHYSH